MPLTGEEMVKRLTDATEEAKATIRELHGARASAMDVIKKHNKELHDTITHEVKVRVGDIYLKTEAEMQQQVADVINRLEDDWRKKLGLDD